MLLKVLIVEDDTNMRLILKRALIGINEVQVVGEAENGTEAVDLANKLEPNVIIMDVELPGKNGFEASKEILDIIPDVFLIYATGHPDYMPEAFEVYAVDYLLKPYKMERLIQTITKIQKLVEMRQRSTLKNGKQITEPICIQHKVAVRNERYLSLIDTNIIVFINREKRKTIIHTDDGKKIMTNDSLDTLEKRTGVGSFMRTHRSYLVNLDKVVEIQPWSRSNYLVVFGKLKEVAYITEERYKELQQKLNFF
ncbi:Autolysis response regulater LytR [Desulfosporosinus sp. I2]|uniref:LytR/AlgR family response regulator transcription factor n=1 Tax=Desulfosporosinus sp. I2 TaxID=1617025 RepID=UPI0005EE7B8F|nr:LytTR family DNA-binding domain-containing protein [Desulfosporosinus sp. I2]KJR44433.1 Autolysis response regulater LytR [Desulfosporosinus sp. I2]